MIDIDGKVATELKRRLQTEADKPFKVAVMGQTGVGKSSLINALFGTNFATDAVRPCTREIQRHVVADKGGELWFFDLPGIGESETADRLYLDDYRRVGNDCDVVLWAMHADMRSVTFDAKSLRVVLGEDPEARRRLLAKIVFVMTKVDLLSPEPWLLVDMSDHAVFAADPATNQLLELKSRYLTEALTTYYFDDLISTTFHDGLPACEGLDVTERHVTHVGLVTDEIAARLKCSHPEHAAVFERLRDNHRTIPCSSRFHFNLSRLMLVIINKLGADAILRFQRFADINQLDKVPLDRAATYFNMLVFDPSNKIIRLDPRDRARWSKPKGWARCRWAVSKAWKMLLRLKPLKIPGAHHGRNHGTVDR